MSKHHRSGFGWFNRRLNAKINASIGNASRARSGVTKRSLSHEEVRKMNEERRKREQSKTGLTRGELTWGIMAILIIFSIIGGCAYSCATYDPMSVYRG